MRVATQNLGLIALTVAEISAFKILATFLSLFNIFQNLQKVVEYGVSESRMREAR